MRNIIPIGISVVMLTALLPWPALADQDSSDSGAPDTSATPSPSPAHHRHTHAKHSPSASPSPDEAGADAGESPAAKPRRHHHAIASDEAATPNESPSPSPAESGEADVSTATPKPSPSVGPDASLATDQLEEFDRQPANVQALIEASLALTRQNLTYTYSSADPANGGMDCSGFTYYILTQAGVKDVPRDAVGQYEWVWKADNFHAVNSRNLDGFELDDLKPGDLLFWTGTYSTDRDPPVTHTMIYLGREKDTGDRVMAGSSDGRTYHGIERWGVSVFDFKAVAAGSTSRPASRFIGYGAIPGL